MAPIVSVVLPVWNGHPYLTPAIESILTQTFPSLELIVVDDGSTDGSAETAREYMARDPRVVVLEIERSGMTPALNAGIAAARGTYIARMDADDVSLPGRIATQVAYLEAHPDCVLVGSGVEIVDRDGRTIGEPQFAESHDEIVASLMDAVSPISHPTVMLRRDAVIAAGGYDSTTYPSEDFDLWLRLTERGQLANLPDVLLRYRRHASSLCVREWTQQVNAGRNLANRFRLRAGLRPLRGAMSDLRVGPDVRYHLQCARTAAVAGPRRVALSHALAALRREPGCPSAYAALLACAVPKSVLQHFLRLRTTTMRRLRA